MESLYWDEHRGGYIPIYRRRVLDEDSPTFDHISRRFHKHSSNRQFSLKITKIEKNNNRVLLRKFIRKKEKYLQMYGQVKVEFLFHGTKRVNIPDILDENLRVDFHGRNVGHRFGAGVSFSAHSYYASHYCDKSRSQMLVCAVLVSNMCVVPEQKGGETFTKPPFIEGLYPPLRYDTTAKDVNKSVLVKFEDHTFFPAYIIHFVKIERQQPSPYDALYNPITSRISNMPSGGSSARQLQSRRSRTNVLRSREEPALGWHRHRVTRYPHHSGVVKFQTLNGGVSANRKSPDDGGINVWALIIIVGLTVWLVSKSGAAQRR